MLVFGGIGFKQGFVFCTGEVVAALGQFDLMLRHAFDGLALREVSHGVVAEQHDGITSVIFHSCASFESNF